MKVPNNLNRRMGLGSASRREFLSFGTMASVTALMSEGTLHAATKRGPTVGEVVVQKSEGVLYLSVTEDVEMGDLLYDGFASRLGEEGIHAVGFRVRKGLLDTLDADKGPTVRLGMSKTQYKLSMNRDREEESLFYGQLTAVENGDDTLKFIYRDVQPLPVIVVIVGLAAVFCLALTLYDKAVKECQEEARRTCGNAGVKQVKIRRVFGIRKEGGWEVGCKADCDIECYPPRQ